MFFVAGTDSVNVVSRLTELLAAHGVYALTVIFIFYQQGRAYKAMQAASAGERKYFRKVYTSVIVATYGLMVLSTGIWFYASFIYSQQSYIRGTVLGLTERRASPTSAADAPELLQDIAAGEDVDLYENKDYGDVQTTGQNYLLRWILFPKGNRRTVVFRFLHYYEVWTTPSNIDPFHNFSPEQLKEKKALPGSFVLDLDAIHYSAGQSIQFSYEANQESPIKKLGTMYVIMSDKSRLPLKWGGSNTDSHGQIELKSRGLSTLMTVWSAHAASTQEEFFKKDGTYDRDKAYILWERLGGANLDVQLATVDFLISQGDRVFKFIEDSLSVQSSGQEGYAYWGLKSKENYSTGLMHHNLESVVRGIEAKGFTVPTEVLLRLAVAFYSDQDFVASAKYFDRAGDVPFHSDDTLFYRAYARMTVGENEKSERDFERYLSKKHKSEFDCAAQDSLGEVLGRLGRNDEAVEQYKKAIQRCPKSVYAYNQLAYWYANRGEHLDEALSLANAAQHLDNTSAAVKDTKGWVLFKLGKPDEALKLIKEAAAASKEPIVREHLAQVQAAVSPIKN
jgi:tetratricopeptide (TPR) repeat protein